MESVPPTVEASRSTAVAVFDREVPVEPQVEPVFPRIELVVPATREQLALISEVVEGFLCPVLDRLRCGDLAREALVALQEAISNVVRHAYRGQAAPGPIGVRVEVFTRLLRVTVTDEGKSYDPSSVPQPDFANPREGGYGLHLMRATMSKVAYSRRGVRNVLLMEKVLEAGAGESGA